jgi:hypothetical protein
MTATFVVVGICYIVTALALRSARTTGRLVLIAGACAGMLVAANPEHPGVNYPWPHIIAASIGLAERVAGASQAVWPLAVVLSCARLGRGGTRLLAERGPRAQAASGPAAHARARDLEPVQFSRPDEHHVGVPLRLVRQTIGEASPAEAEQAGVGCTRPNPRTLGREQAAEAT